METQISGSFQFKNLRISPNITNICGGGGTVAKPCPTFAIPWTLVCQAPLSIGIPRQAYWSGLPFPSPTFRGRIITILGLNPNEVSYLC